MIGIIKSEWSITRQERIGGISGGRQEEEEESRHEVLSTDLEQVRHVVLRKGKRRM